MTHIRAKFFEGLSCYAATLALACSLACIGCTSVESTLVTRSESNEYWERHNCLNGIPITIRVPTHLKVYVFHKHLLEPEYNKAGNISNYHPIDMGVVIRDFAQEFMYTEKVFVVDFKRPAAGSANLRVKMTDQQYLSEVQQDITDRTIADVRGLFAAATGTNFQTASDTEPVASGNFTPIRSLVAAGIFEIDSPDFEDKVRTFMEFHVNRESDDTISQSVEGS